MNKQVDLMKWLVSVYSVTIVDVHIKQGFTYAEMFKASDCSVSGLISALGSL